MIASVKSKRGPLRPRATSSLSVAAETVTDRTAPLVFGLEPRPFRDFVTSEHVPHARLGRRIVVRVDDMLDALARVARAQTETSEVEDEEDDDDGQPKSVDDVLRKLGKERVA